jgi:hypothetical protein
LGDDYDTLLAEAEPILEQFGVVEPVPDGELHTRAARLLADLLPAPVVTPPPAAAEYVALANRAAEYLAGLPQLREQPRDEHGRFAEGGGTSEPSGGGGGKASGTGGHGVRGALSGHETAEAVGAAAAAEAKAITGRDIEFDMAGSDPQIAAEHAEGILQGLERFPGTGLGRVQYGGDPAAEHAEAWASTSPDGHTITFTRDAQKYGVKSYRQDLKNAEQGRELAPGVGSPRGVALHEFGHAVVNSYGINERMDSHMRDYTEHAMNSDHHGASVMHELGRRAAVSHREANAEAFAHGMVRGSRASGLARDFMTMLPVVVRSAGGS